MQACFFAQYLLKKGIVSQSQLDEALIVQRQHNRTLGSLAVSAGLLTEEQVEQLNAEQLEADLYLGEMAVEKGWMTSNDVELLMIEQWASHSSIGDILVEQELLNVNQLDSLLADFQYYQRRLRESSDQALRKLPESEFIQTFLKELVKCSERICHEKVAVGEVTEHTVKAEDLPFVGLLALEDKPLAYFGVALDADQAHKITLNIGYAGEQDVQNSDLNDIAGTEKFVRLAAESACRKLNSGERQFSIVGAYDSQENQDLPSCENLISVEMVTEQSGFKALFLSQ